MADSDEAEAHIERADALHAQGDAQGALTCYRAARALAPGDVEAWTSEGHVLVELYRFSEAALSFDRAIACDPDDADLELYRRLALRRCGGFCGASGCVRAALQCLRDARPIEPLCSMQDLCGAVDSSEADPRPWLSRGVREEGEPEVAIGHYSHAASLASLVPPSSPDSACTEACAREASTGEGNALMSLGRFGDAALSFGRGVSAIAASIAASGAALPVCAASAAALAELQRLQLHCAERACGDGTPSGGGGGAWRVRGPAPTGKEVARRLDLHGAVHVEGAVAPDVCARVLAEVATALAAGSGSAPSAGHALPLGSIREPDHRVDLFMPLSGAVREAIAAVFAAWRTDLWDVLTPGAWITECSALVSWTGAEAQAWHVDTYRSGEGAAGSSEGGGRAVADARLVTAAIALAPVTHAQGPTSFRLGSHRMAHDGLLGCPWGLTGLGHGSDAVGESEARATEHVAATAQPGDVTLWDSNVVHRGGAHTHGAARALLYVTFLGGDGAPIPTGSAGSLLPEYGGRVAASGVLS